MATNPATDAELLSVIEKGSTGWGVRDFAHATALAAAMTERGGAAWLPVDYGTSRSPRYTIVPAPVVGAAVSYGFNGDFYPCGNIVRVSSVTTGAKRVEARDDAGAVSVFYRHKLSGSWIKAGGTWCMVAGHRDERNPSF